jgi:hypothetical protein
MNFEKNLVKIALYISSNDGVLSEVEEQELIKLSLENFSELEEAQIAQWVDEFFDEEEQMEFYCSKISDKADQLLVLDLSIASAAVDGLSTKENLALSRVMNFWGITWEDISHG